MNDLRDRAEFDWNRLKHNFFRFSKSKHIIKYLASIVLILGIIFDNRITVLFVAISLLITIYIDSFREDDYKKWRLLKYGGESPRKTKQWYRRLGVVKKMDKEELEKIKKRQEQIISKNG